MANSAAPAKSFPPRLVRLLIAWVPFALGMGFVVFASIAAPDIPHARAKFSIWLSIALAAPALALFIRDYRLAGMTQTWRLYWTFALAAYLVHLWYAFVIMFHASVAAVIASQGVVTASFNTLTTVLWFADVVSAWLRAGERGATILRVAAHAAVGAAAVLSTILFARDATSVVLGLFLLAAIGTGFYLRLGAQARD